MTDELMVQIPHGRAHAIVSWLAAYRGQLETQQPQNAHFVEGVRASEELLKEAMQEAQNADRGTRLPYDGGPR